jgi:hypothetical protein
MQHSMASYIIKDRINEFQQYYYIPQTIIDAKNYFINNHYINDLIDKNHRSNNNTNELIIDSRFSMIRFMNH